MVGKIIHISIILLARVQVLLQFNFAETCYYLSKTDPKKKKKRKEHRENAH
jgi:hypothetical protein